MKRNAILMSVALALSIEAVQAINGETWVPSVPRPIILKPKNPISTRPKAPLSQEIACTYADGSLYFEFAIPEGGCQLTMTNLNTGEVFYTDFNSEATEPVYIGYHDSGEISISTEYGNTYTGSW